MRESRELKAVQQEVAYLERKLSTHQATENNLLQTSHTIHQVKMEKKLIVEQLKRALSDVRQEGKFQT